MRTIAIILVSLSGAMLLPATVAKGGLHVFSLPDLAGSYEFNDFGSGVAGQERTSIATSIPWDDVAKVTLTFTGTGIDGLACGDGFLYEPENVVLPDCFWSLLTIGHKLYEFRGGPWNGAGTLQFELSSPFERVPAGQPEFFGLDIIFALTPWSLTPTLPTPKFVPAQPLLLGDGLIMIQPVTANISEAYMTVETFVPEPATLALVALGVAGALLRRRGR